MNRESVKRTITSVLLIISLISSLVMFTACSKKEDDELESEVLKRKMDMEDNDFDNPDFDDEQDGAEVLIVGHDKEDFIGTWYGPSERVKYYWGNVDLRIKEDGTWTGNVTEEKLKGKWHYDGTGIIIKDTEDLVDWELFYASDGELMFRNREEPEDAYVLKKGTGN